MFSEQSNSSYKLCAWCRRSCIGCSNIRNLHHGLRHIHHRRLRDHLKINNFENLEKREFRNIQVLSPRTGFNERVFTKALG